MLFEGYESQDMPFICPECNYYMNQEDMVGVGEYPLNLFRSNQFIPELKAAGFECPKCFTKSVCHTDKWMIQTFETYQKIKRMKEKDESNSTQTND